VDQLPLRDNLQIDNHDKVIRPADRIWIAVRRRALIARAALALASSRSRARSLKIPRIARMTDEDLAAMFAYVKTFRARL
jgi:hypothetical protein